MALPATRAMPRSRSLSSFMKASQHPSGGVLRGRALRRCARCAVRTSERFSSPNENGAVAPFRKNYVRSRLGIQDAKLERLADRLRAVDDVQLAQDFLHVVLHRERADLEDRADLEIRLAEVDPFQDVELADREH